MISIENLMNGFFKCSKKSVGLGAIALIFSGCELTVYENGQSFSDSKDRDSTVVGTTTSTDPVAPANDGNAEPEVDSPADSVSLVAVATQLIATPSVSSVSAGSSISVSIQTLDANNSVTSGYVGTLSFASSDSAAVLPSALVVTAANAGSVSVSGFEFRTAGTHTLTVSDGTLTKTITGIVVQPASLASLSFSQQPAGTNIIAGASFTTPPEVLARDVYGNPISGQNLTLQAYTSGDCATTAGSGSLASATASTAASTGVAQFSGANYSKAGETIYFKVISGVVTACSTGSVSVVAGAASALSFTTQPGGTDVAAAADFTSQPVVRVLDAYGNGVASASVELTAYTDASCTLAATGTLSGATIVSNASGISTFSSVDYTKAETIYLKASVGSLHSACSSGSVGVVAGSISSVVFTTQPGGTNVAAGSSITTQPVVTLKDAYNNLVGSTTVTLSVSNFSNCAGGGTIGTLNNETASTNSSGVATFSGLNYTYAATIYLKATAGSASVCSTGTVSVVPGSPSDVTFSTQAVGSSITAGSSITTQPVVTVKDAYLNPIGSQAVTLAAFSDSSCQNAGTGTLNDGSATTNGSGVATFSGVDYTKSGSLYFIAAAGSASSLCSTGAISIVAGAPASVAFTTQPGGTSVAAGASFTTQPVVTVKDSLDNTVASQSVVLTAFSNSGCSTPATGTLNNGGVTTDASGVSTFSSANFTKAGTIYIKATAGSASICSTGTVGIVAGAAGAITWQTQPAGSVGAGVAFSTQPVVLVEDSYGNALASQVATLAAYTNSGCTTPAGGTLSNSTATSNGSGVATFSGASQNTAGTFYFAVTAGSAASSCSASTVTTTSTIVMSTASGQAGSSCVIKNGALWCWGGNYASQLGTGDTVNRLTPLQFSSLVGTTVSQFSSGDSTTCVLVNGAIQCLGSNTYGRLGDGTTTSRTSLVSVSGLGSGVTQITSGYAHTCAVVGGAAKCWGYNIYGQLGIGNTTDSLVPVTVSGLTSGVSYISAGSSHTCAVVNGAAKCWGTGGSGRLGNNSTSGRTTPVQVSSLTANVTQVNAGTDYSCAIVSGAVKCWGYNDSGTGTYYQLGSGTTAHSSVPIPVSGIGSGATHLALGQYTSCAIVSGQARCWGFNGFGQLGRNTTTATSTPKVVSGLTSGVTDISMTYHTGCAVVSGVAKCWGQNNVGKVGEGSTVNRLTAVNVSGL